ncbi:hypothetical protein EG329_012062 [Mollisiaceae sp. DMI_Dod_QoI]|nr:hypothetical protein EG329_012062 [Helotiales sp. DMI_Dod_QoI]
MTLKVVFVPVFPLNSPPICRYCHQISIPRIVEPGNLKGNAGRPYYICEDCNGQGSSRWIAWGDKIGIHVLNPTCYCGIVTHKAGAGTMLGKGNVFWTCAWGRCGFFRAASGMAVLPRVQTISGFGSGTGAIASASDDWIAKIGKLTLG